MNDETGWRMIGLWRVWDELPEAPMPTERPPEALLERLAGAFDRRPTEIEADRRRSAPAPARQYGTPSKRGRSSTPSNGRRCRMMAVGYPGVETAPAGRPTPPRPAGLRSRALGNRTLVDVRPDEQGTGRGRRRGPADLRETADLTTAPRADADRRSYVVILPVVTTRRTTLHLPPSE